jgi:hypothetical protein
MPGSMPPTKKRAPARPSQRTQAYRLLYHMGLEKTTAGLGRLVESLEQWYVAMHASTAK